MNFYEYTAPYFALIKAANLQESHKLYNKMVAELNEYEEGKFDVEVTEVERDYAIVTFCTAVDDSENPSNKILEAIKSNENMILVVDGNLF